MPPSCSQPPSGNHDDLATINYPPISKVTAKGVATTPMSVAACGSCFWTPCAGRGAADLGPEHAQQAVEPWRIAYFHHPLYGNAGRHGLNVHLRVLLEPLLLEFGVQVVFSGHDHVYERLKPQRGVHYFVAGSGGQLRKGDLQSSDLTAAGFDQDQAFMLVEISGNDLHFQTVSRTGPDRGLGRDSPKGERRQLRPKETTMSTVASRGPPPIRRAESRIPGERRFLARWWHFAADHLLMLPLSAQRSRSPGSTRIRRATPGSPARFHSSSRTSRWCCSSG